VHFETFGAIVVELGFMTVACDASIVGFFVFVFEYVATAVKLL